MQLCSHRTGKCIVVMCVIKTSFGVMCKPFLIPANKYTQFSAVLSKRENPEMNNFFRVRYLTTTTSRRFDVIVVIGARFQHMYQYKVSCDATRYR